MMKILSGITFCFLSIITCAQEQITKLDKNWQFRQAGKTQWYKAEVPGTVHTDLLTNKLIPDPFFRDNESKVQWVEKASWEYKTSFTVSPALFSKKHIEIVFDGLDTYAEVLLNGKKILDANNMFRGWTVDVKDLLKQGTNSLLVKFSPVSVIAKQKKKEQAINYPDNERVFVRKAQYQFGWDWGPRLVTCGIWKEVRLQGYDEEDLSGLINDIHPTVKLVITKDSIGESFYFTRNGKPTFIKGANWIPSDNFIPRAKKIKRYEQLIKAAREANINMLRVWGGGVYEDDEFYDLCDRYGIMVWQDFMFAGAMYPADETFLKNIEEEVRYQVKRLRNHPCIAIWCGNNEIEEAWFNWGWQKQFGYSAQDSLKLWNDYKKIFHEVIPNVLKELDPQRPYWPSSPSLGWGRDSAYKKGDVHYWGVWWGQEPVEKYNEKVGRFVSEYGMQGMPDMKTIKQFSLPQDWDTASAVMNVHQKHPFGWGNIKYYVDQKFKAPKTFEDLVYVSQLMQADAIKTAIEAHRRNKPVTMGTMFWQWNDCWPVTSWSAVDYYGRPKALYYEVKRDYKGLVVLPYVDPDFYRIKVVSDLDTNITARLETDFISFTRAERNVLKSDIDFVVRANETFIARSKRDISKEFAREGCMRFRLVENGKTVAENILFLTSPKNLNLVKTKIEFTVSNNTIELVAPQFAYGVFIDLPDGVELEDNFFHLLPNEKKIVKFASSIPVENIRKNIKIKSLADTY